MRSKVAKRAVRRSGVDAAVELREALLAWYRSARRELPWRATRDPYAVWISEAMLQQTRVETVEPYWRRFMARFPTLAALAAAREDEVLAQWSGLGYYRRARSLRAAALAIVERHAGEFPRDAALARDLPGVGPYTAGAVLSIAFDAPEALVDGNVERVFARLFALDGAAGSGLLRERTWELARSLVPARDAGDWNQALMELGATLCSPKDPRCDICPVADHCRSLALGRAHDFPAPKRRRASVAVELEALLVLRDEQRVLLERRGPGGRMAGLWQLPTIELSRAGHERTDLHPLRYGIQLAASDLLCEVRHTITHHRIRAVLRRGRCRARSVSLPFAWIERAELHGQALTGLARKLLAAHAAWDERAERGMLRTKA